MLDSGDPREDVDAVISLIAAVNAGAKQAIARRGYQHIADACPSYGAEQK